MTGRLGQGGMGVVWRAVQRSTHREVALKLLGVILYRRLTGDAPHDMDGTRYEILRRIAQEEVKRPREVNPSIDRELEALLLKALAHEPEGRYGSAGELAQDIDNYLNGDPLAAKSPTVMYFLRKRLRKHRVPILVGCAIVAVIAASVAGIMHYAAKAGVSAQVAEAARVFDAKLEASQWTERDLADLESAIAELDRLLFEKPGVYRPSMAALLVERARVHASLKQWDKAEEDIDAYFRLRPPEPEGRLPEACLVRGYLRERRGDASGALQSWHEGLFREVTDAAAARGRQEHWKPTSGQEFLYYVILGGLTKELPETEIESVVTEAAAAKFPDARNMMSLIPRDVVQTAMTTLCEMWRTPRGRELARKIAFHDLPFPEYARMPSMLFATEMVRRELFPDGLSTEQDELLWKTADAGYAAYTSGRISRTQVVRLLLTWLGTTNVLGWEGAAPTLEPALRGPIAYLYGFRYLRLNRPADAVNFFSAAVKDSEPDSPLRRLAQAELDRMKKAN